MDGPKPMDPERLDRIRWLAKQPGPFGGHTVADLLADRDYQERRAVGAERDRDSAAASLAEARAEARAERATRGLFADNSWARGTVLIGRESVEGWWSDSIIVITYISEQHLLALELCSRSSISETWGASGSEGSWTLGERPWRRATSEDITSANARTLLSTLRDRCPVLASFAELQLRRIEWGGEFQLEDDDG